MSQEGKISVLMGLYNCEHSLPAALDSILAQTYYNWELILCDDASTDGTWDVARQYYVRYPERIVLLRNEQNRKLAYTLNRCLQAASGEFVARMDADDRSLPSRFETQVAFLRAHPEIVLVGTGIRRFDDEGTYGEVLTCPARPDRFSPHYGTVFNHPTVLAYKSVYEALGGYTVLARTARGQDLDLWFRFLNAGYCGANLQEPLYELREDYDAIKRRSWRTRWLVFQTKWYGYRLLGYPWYWYWEPFYELAKIVVPPKLLWRMRRRSK